jgi:hypothetical protein
MKTKFFVALAAFVTVFSACQKDPDDNNNGGADNKDYQPTTAGSTWQYRSTASGDYTETATGQDTTINGQKYFIFRSEENGSRYVNKANNVYTTFGYVQQVDQTINIIYLKDAAVGTTWTNSANYNGFPVDLTYTIVSRDGEKVVNGTTYRDVIELNFTVSTNNPLTGLLTVATGKQFHAKGVGSITSTFNFELQNNTASDSTYLVSASIK